MKKYILYTIAIYLLYRLVCGKRYDHSSKVCSEKLYVEQFFTPVGVDIEYLTDSLNFRLYVGKRDDEHENFTYECKGDSIIIKKIDSSFEKFIDLEKRVFNEQDLINKGRFE